MFFFFFNDTATTEIYTLSLHDALPIYGLGLEQAHRDVPVLAYLVGLGLANGLAAVLADGDVLVDADILVAVVANADLLVVVHSLRAVVVHGDGLVAVDRKSVV